MEKQKTPLSTPTNKQKKIEDLKKIKKTSE
jgi:hypothetical protein